MRKTAFAFVCISIAITVWGRQARPVQDGPAMAATIRELKREPGRFDGRLVIVSGVVGKRLSLAGYGGYELQGADGGEAVFVGATQSPPEIGALATVTGRFTTLLTAGSVSVAFIQEASR